MRSSTPASAHRDPLWARLGRSSRDRKEWAIHCDNFRAPGKRRANGKPAHTTLYVVDMDAIRSAGLQLGVDPLG